MKNTSLKIIAYTWIILCFTTVWSAQQGNPYVSPSHALMRQAAVGGFCGLRGLGSNCANMEGCSDAVSTVKRDCLRIQNHCVCGSAFCVIWVCLGPEKMIAECIGQGAEFVGNVQASAARAFACQSRRAAESVSE